MANSGLKEFFYVDVDRTRSLLAQLQGGFIESLVSEKAHEVDAKASASLFGIGGSGGYTHTTSAQESRSFQEMIFVAFERLADEHGFISELGELSRDSEAWRTGQAQDALREGEIVRIRCDVQILDGKLFGERITRFDQMADHFAGLSEQAVPTPRNSTPQQRKRLGAQMRAMTKAAIMGGITSEQLVAISGLIDAFVGEGISLRALPCGVEHLGLGFQGSLLGRREYIQEERETLFSRYGTGPKQLDLRPPGGCYPCSTRTRADSRPHRYRSR